MGSNVEFKVGDRVRRVKRDHSSGRGLCVGQEGVIGGVSDMFSGRRFKIEGEEDQLAHDPDNLELVTPTTWAPAEGKYGKTRDGRKVGPMRKRTADNKWLGDGVNTISLGVPSGHPQVYNDDGSVFCCRPQEEGHTLVAEWVEPVATTASPVREVSRKEILPGVYGAVSIKERHPRYENSANICIQPTHMSADDLTAAIATLTTVRDALREVA